MSETKSSAGVRRHLAAGAWRLRANGWPILQTAVAAAGAYLLSTYALGIQQAFFAPIAAVICLGLTLGERGRRAFEVAVGVALGLLVADLIVHVIGAAQIAAVVILAMAAAVLLGGRTLLVNQAAISGILVLVLQPPDTGFVPVRFFSAVTGVGVALAVSYLFPVNPEHAVERTAHRVFEELAAVLEDLAAALERGTGRRPGACWRGPGNSTTG